MWNSTAGDHHGAGFIESPGQFASPSFQGKKERRTNNLLPVTIKSIEESSGDTIMVGDTEIRMVVIVGIIRTVKISSTKINYKIDDSTGIIEAVHWVEDREYDEGKEKPLMEMTYARLVGTLKTQQGKKHIMILKIEPLTDINRMTTHILEVIYNRMKLVELQMKDINLAGPSGGIFPGKRSSDTSDGGGFGGKSAFSGAANYMQNRNVDGGLTGINSMVFQLIQLCSDANGESREFIHSQLKMKSTTASIDQALEFLINEGHIYSTSDEDHFKSTDS